MLPTEGGKVTDFVRVSFSGSDFRPVSFCVKLSCVTAVGQACRRSVSGVRCSDGSIVCVQLSAFCGSPSVLQRSDILVCRYFMLPCDRLPAEKRHIAESARPKRRLPPTSPQQWAGQKAFRSEQGSCVVRLTVGKAAFPRPSASNLFQCPLL